MTAYFNNPYSDNHHNQAISEWKAIRNAKGYHGSFPNWVLEHELEWYPNLPDPNYLQRLLDITKEDCKNMYYRHDSFCKIEFKEKVTTDFKELGGKFTYS